MTPGVETTTGPLGQGLGNAVGMALAEKLLAAEFNRPGHAIVDHHTYVFLGDGCLMEGISHEACALAGAWKLNKLVALYDDNGISIDGAGRSPGTSTTCGKRFEAYGWNVIGPIDGHDVDAVDAALGAGAALGDAADADHLPHHHRQGLAEPRRHRQGARRGAGRRGDRADARGAGLAARALRDPRGGATRCGTPRRAGDAAAGRLGSRASPPTAPRTRSWRPSSQRRMAGELPADFAQMAVDAAIAAHAKAETVASRKASQIALEAFTKAPARAARRLGRPDRLQPDQHRVDAGAALRRARRAQRRAPHQLRRARVRHGRGDERHRAARRLHPLRRHLPDLQRLQPQRHPHGRADEAARDPRLHARQHRPGRGRPDAPERRARGQPAPDPEPGRLAPGRHGRDRGRLDDGAGQRHAAERAAAEPAEPALRAQGRAGRDRQGRLRAGRAGRGRAEEEGAGGDHRHRQRGAAGAACAGRAGQATASRCAWSACPARPCSTARPWPTRPRCCRPSCRASRSRPASPTAGGSTAAPPSSASTATARARRRRRCSSISASRRRTWRTRCARCCVPATPILKGVSS